ncbi:MAG: hypothetical protein AAF211_01760 [Myxococcota bacterium]
MALALGLLTVLSTPAQATGLVPFDVVFSNCTEYVGTTPVSPVEAQTRVPSGSTLALTADGDAQVVARFVDCASIEVDGGPARPGRISQIGVVLDLQATSIVNYTLQYATDNVRLWARLRLAGLPAVFDRDLGYGLTPNGDGTSTLDVDVVARRISDHDLVATNVGTPAIPIPFVATWLFDGFRGTVDTTTPLPDIVFFFGAGGTLTTPPSTDLAVLLGGPSVSFGFPFFDSFNAFGTAVMSVSILP